MAVTARPAATVVAVRAGEGGMEVLMFQRPPRGFFGGMWVFPGGVVEPVDRSDLASQAVITEADADDAPWRAAALRETVEELALAITDPPIGRPLVAHGVAVYEEVVTAGLRLDGTRLRFLSRWVTPETAPSRYDVNFYLTVIEGDPDLVPQAEEVGEVRWVEPAVALGHHRRGEWQLVLPTLRHLEWLEGLADVDQAWKAAEDPVGVDRP